MKRSIVPEVVCLCGSTKFIDVFDREMPRLTLEGKIVLTVGSHTSKSRQYADGLDGKKAALDELHLRKIDLADRVLVLNVRGCTGDSTKREIAYALATGKRVDFLEPLTKETRIAMMQARHFLPHQPRRTP